MKVSELQTANDAVFDAYQQAFSETDRKGHANETEIKHSLQDCVWRLNKFLQEKTTPAEHRESVSEVRTLLSDAIRAEYRKGVANPALTSPSTVAERVYRTIIESPTTAKVIFKQQQVLASRVIKAEVKREVKRGAVTPAAADRDLKWSALQPELGFHDIEAFRGVPKVIEFLDPATRRKDVIPYTKSLAWQRQSSLELHRAKNEDRLKEYNRELQADLALQPLVAKLGDHPAAQLWAMEILQKPKRSNG